MYIIFLFYGNSFLGSHFVFIDFFTYLCQKVPKMTATQIFIAFLKTLEPSEMMYFMSVLNTNGGHKRRKKDHKIANKTFVEDYLCKYNRSLYNYFTRLFFIAPDLLKKRRKLKTYYENNRLYFQFGKRHYDGNGHFIIYYRNKWHNFLNNNFEHTRRIFKKGQPIEFKPNLEQWRIRKKYSAR